MRKDIRMRRKERARSRKKQAFPTKAAAIVLVVLLFLLAVTAGLYIYKGQQYKEVFFQNTKVNGMNASGKTVEEMKAEIASGIDGYALTLEGRDGITETITGEEIVLHSVFDGTLETILEEQDPLKWWDHRKKPVSHEIKTMIAYEEEALQSRIDGLNLFAEDLVVEPKDAYLSDYVSGQGYSVMPEVKGNRLDQEKVTEAISEAILGLQETISLEELDAYVKPEITSENEELAALAANLNKHAGVTVTYQFGDKTEVLSGETIHTWLSVNADKTIALNRDEVAAYVKGLASKYNTAYQKKNLKTSYGQTVTISQGFYGWRINQGAETDELYNIIRSGESTTREPVYSQKAASHGANDYGNTYVELNLTAQHLFFYKDGKLLVETDFVSGNTSKKYDTPAGAYPITYKERNATLKGENYATPVSYWMPFNGNIGMHDADWRSSFGGSIYKTNGSHGCVNLPPSVAKTIYENISAGMPVLCYFLEGTESGKSSSAVKETTAPASTAETTKAPETTAPPQTSPAVPETTPVPETSPTQPETTAPETAPAPPETQPEATKKPAGPGETGAPETTKKKAGPGES